MKSANRRREALTGAAFILPSFVLLLTFSIVPIGMALFYSFTKFNVVQAPVWIGLQNYARLRTDPYVESSIVNTIVYTLVTVPCQTALSLLFAAILAEFFRGRFGGFVKSALFVPVIASSVLVGTLFVFMLATDEGAVNAVLSVFGVPKINWLGGKQTAMISLCLAAIWKNVGYFLVIFYAGIMDIPPSLYEAARVDGASKRQQFFRITLPSLKQVLFLVLVLGTIWSFQVFDLVYAMTNGGPGRATVTLVLTIYKTAFKEFNMGSASAISMLLFVIVTAISAVQRFLFRDADAGRAER